MVAIKVRSDAIQGYGRYKKSSKFPLWEHCKAIMSAGAPFVRFKDRNVSYHSLVGMDPTPDGLEEMLRLRIFIVSQHQDQSTDASIVVRGSIMRESLDYQPKWDVECNPRHYCVCLDYQWRSRLFLRARSDGKIFPMAFMDEIPGVPYYFEHCPRAQGGYDPMANISPFFMQVGTYCLAQSTEWMHAIRQKRCSCELCV